MKKQDKQYKEPEYYRIEFSRGKYNKIELNRINFQISSKSRKEEIKKVENKKNLIFL